MRITAAIFIAACVMTVALGLLASSGHPRPRPRPPQYEPPPPGCSLWTGGGLDPAAEAWLHDSLGSQCHQQALKATIPRILHHIYLPDKNTFLTKSQDSRSATNPLWSESCLRLHPQWQHVFWGEKEAVAFLEKVD